MLERVTEASPIVMFTMPIVASISHTERSDYGERKLQFLRVLVLRVLVLRVLVLRVLVLRVSGPCQAASVSVLRAKLASV